MTNNKQTYKPHDKTISPFSDFIINSTDEEKKRVFEVACELANQDQRNMIERANNKQNWREELNELIPEDVDIIFMNKEIPICSRQAIVNLIEKTLQEQREEVRKAEKDRVVRIVTEYFEKGLGFNKGSMNDSVFEGLKDALLKELKK